VSAPFPSGTFTIATLRLRAKAVSAGTDITYNVSGVRTTSAFNGGVSVLRASLGSTITITTTATVEGTVTIQTRASVANALVRVRVVPASGGAAVYDQIVALDNAGKFSVSGIVPGTYHLWVKHANTLSSSAANTVLGAGNNAVTLSVLRGGDATGTDNLVNIQDFSLLATAFGTTPISPNFDIRADFNADALINIQDFSILATNFGQLGSMMGAP